MQKQITIYMFVVINIVLSFSKTGYSDTLKDDSRILILKSNSHTVHDSLVTGVYNRLIERLEMTNELTLINEEIKQKMIDSLRLDEKFLSIENLNQIREAISVNRIYRLFVDCDDSLSSILIKCYDGTTGDIVDFLTVRYNSLAEHLTIRAPKDLAGLIESKDKHKYLYESINPDTINDGMNNLVINTIPIGAKIFVDNIYFGESPNTIENLKEGVHIVEIVKDGYFESIKNIKISKNNSDTLEIDLIEATGTIFINCDVKNTDVFLNKKQGELFMKDIKYGEYAIEVKHEDYKSFQDTIIINSQDGTFVNALLNTSFISIHSMPDNAEAYLDGVILSYSKEDIFKIPIGEHKLILDDVGYEETSIEFNTRLLEKKIINLDLPPLSQKKSIIYSSLFPGLGQIYSERTLVGTVFLTSELFFIASSVWTYNQTNVLNSEFRDLENIYKTSTIESERLWAKKWKDRKSNEIDTFKHKNILFITSAIGVWLLNVFHVYFYPPKIPLKLKLNTTIYSKNEYSERNINLSFQYQF